MKKVKEDQSISWKKVGNEKQFKFNDSLEAKFDSAIAAIEKKKLDKAKQSYWKSFQKPFQFRQANSVYARDFQKKTSSRSLLCVWIGRALEKTLSQRQVLHKIR